MSEEFVEVEHYQGIGAQKKCHDAAGDDKFFIVHEADLGTIPDPKDPTKTLVKSTNVYMSYRNHQEFFEEVYCLIDPKDRRFYEQIRDACVEHYDIDGDLDGNIFKHYKMKDGSFDSDKYIKEFMEERTKFILQSKGWNPGKYIRLLVKDSCKDNKVSLHLIVRSHDNGPEYYFPTKVMCKKYMLEFREYLRSQWCELSKYIEDVKKDEFFDHLIYTKNRNLRLLGSHKLKNPERPLVRGLYNSLSEHTDQWWFCASYIAEGSVPIEEQECEEEEEEEEEDTKKKRKKHTEPVETDTGCINSIEEIIKGYAQDNFKVGQPKNNLYQLVRLKPSHCPICDRTHDNDNQYVTLYDGRVYLGCYRSSNKSGHMLGRYKASTIEKVEGKVGEKKELYYEVPILNVDWSKVTVYGEDVKWVQKYKPTKKLCIVQAGLGCGKTKQMINCINKVGDKTIRIIALSPRQTFAKNFTAEINRGCERQFSCYLDKNLDIPTCQSLVIQCESLHKLQQSEFNGILIIDEIESLLTQATATTHGKNIEKNFTELKRLISSAKHVFMMDGYISNKTMDFVAGCKLDYEFHLYKVKPEAREAIQIQKKADLLSNLINTLRADKKVAFYCSSKRKLDGYFLKNVTESLPDKRIKVYTADTSSDDLDRIRETWINYDLVIYTGVITVGVNFDVGCNDGETPYFDELFCYLSRDSNNLVRDVFQGLKRVRKISSNVLKYHLCTKLSTHDTDRPLSTRAIADNFKKSNEELSYLFKDNYTTCDRDLMSLAISNRQEANQSVILMEQMWHYYIDLNNYKFSLVSSEQNMVRMMQEDKFKEDKSVPNLFEIEDISESEMRGLKQRQDKGERLTLAEKLEMMKYFFVSSIVIEEYEEDPERASKLWAKYYNHQQQKLREMTYRKGLIQGTVTMEQLFEREGEVHLLTGGNAVVRVKYMTEICKALNIVNDQEEQEIPRETVLAFSKRLEENVGPVVKGGIQETYYEALARNFGLQDRRKNKKDPIDFKVTTYLLSSIWDACGTAELKVGERKRRMVNRVKSEITPAVISNPDKLFEIIQPYTDYKRTWTKFLNRPKTNPKSNEEDEPFVPRTRAYKPQIDLSDEADEAPPS